VVVTGDFNDEPGDPAVQMLTAGEGRSGGLVNLMEQMQGKIRGTLYFDGRWWLFDQFLVSTSLFNRCSAEVLSFPFLFDPEQEEKPWRTYAGLRYLGGFSDHLPVVLTLTSDKK
jgi:hypothetical protein